MCNKLPPLTDMSPDHIRVWASQVMTLVNSLSSKVSELETKNTQLEQKLKELEKPQK